MKAIFFIGTATLVLVAAILVRSTREVGPGTRTAVVNRTVKPAPAAVHVPVAQLERPKEATPEDLGKISENLRVKATYQNYRAAVATNNQPLQHALLPILLKDRVSALKYAEDDLARSTDSFDRSVNQRTVDALNR